jgi:hypothetical protein
MAVEAAGVPIQVGAAFTPVAEVIEVGRLQPGTERRAHQRLIHIVRGVGTRLDLATVTPGLVEIIPQGTNELGIPLRPLRQ